MTIPVIIPRMYCVTPLAVFIGGVLLVGCAAEDQATVVGKVTMDGRPLDRGVVTFVNALGKSSAGISGQIHGDGTYDVQIGQSGEVVAGEYAVAVVARTPSITTQEGAPPTPGELLVPDRYTRIETSGLRYHVRPGKNIIDIALAGAVETPPESSGEDDSRADSGESESGHRLEGGESNEAGEESSDL